MKAACPNCGTEVKCGPDPVRLASFPEFEGWKAEGEAVLFFGFRVREMDRDELVALVGYMSRAIVDAWPFAPF